MAITRPDTFVTVSFTKENDQWKTVVVHWREEINDGTSTWERERHEDYRIADLPAQVRADLLSAWNGMKAHRDSITPIN